MKRRPNFRLLTHTAYGNLDDTVASVACVDFDCSYGWNQTHCEEFKKSASLIKRIRVCKY